MPETISVSQIVSRYRSVVGALDNMFKVIGLRSEVELWRVDGVGSCRNMDRESSEYHLGGPAKNELIRLREERNRNVPGKPSPLTDCPYHREGFGCVLGDLKGPYCISHIDRPSTLKRQLRINGYELMQDIDQVLQSILLMGGTSPDIVEAISEMTKYIETYPILGMEDRPFFRWILSQAPEEQRTSRSFFICKYESEYY